MFRTSEYRAELAKAAEDLKKELGEAAKDLEQGAENVNRMAQRELDDEQKREMIRRLRELREVMRQDSQGGESRKERLQRFSERARGGQRPGQQGKDGEASLVVVTHRASDASLTGTVEALRNLDTVRGVASIMRVEGE